MALSEFDIQILRDSRWTTEAVRGSEMDARALATKYLKDPECAGARVVANRTMRDGTINEIVVFEETQSVSGDKPVRITPIESIKPYCKTPKDFFGLECRMHLNRLFREYLEDVTLPPTEVLHSHKQLQRLFERDSLRLSAVSHIASLQVKGQGKSNRQRQAELNIIIDQIAEQAHEAVSIKLPKLGGKFSRTIAGVPKIQSQSVEYLAMVTLSCELIKLPSWIGKLDLLCEMALRETDRTATLLLDTVIADLLGANVIQEILGAALQSRSIKGDGGVPARPGPAAGAGGYSLRCSGRRSTYHARFAIRRGRREIRPARRHRGNRQGIVRSRPRHHVSCRTVENRAHRRAHGRYRPAARRCLQRARHQSTLPSVHVPQGPHGDGYRGISGSGIFGAA
ncbi:hypothetical protein L2D14_17230 [Thalassospiraceae bacterium LMO-JJ14]|nr:hypothetical protein L2D14_17230 [Thalassospiraceae bacterium LMO-JJ14]